MMLDCEELSGIALSGAIDKGLTVRICSVVLVVRRVVVRCDSCFFFGVSTSLVEIAVALFKAVAAGVITPEAPAEKNGETIIFIIRRFSHKISHF